MSKPCLEYQEDTFEKPLLFVKGDWTSVALKKLRIPSFQKKAQGPVSFDFKQMTSLDTLGALKLLELMRIYSIPIESLGSLNLSEKHLHLLQYVRDQKSLIVHPLPVVSDPYSLTKLTIDVGHSIVSLLLLLQTSLDFLGRVLVDLFLGFSYKKPIRLTSLGNHCFRVGVQAPPIVGLISFLIGVVLVYQGATQLKRFGAEIFTVDLLGVSILREVGGLLAAIVVAGRSGSAFAAQIGVMKLNQETDALTVMGLNPSDVLVTPRVLALVIMMPILTFWADVLGVIGGAVMSLFAIQLSFSQFFKQFSQGVTLWTFWVGMIKAPVFGFVIALIGCYEGFQVRGGAESIGRHTTQAVVKGIFAVIVLDALFSILFSRLGW